jgi:hypothetical protein
MGKTATLEQAIGAWQELMSADACEDDGIDRSIDRWERQILDSPIEGASHAAAICDIVAHSLEGGSRSDERDLMAIMRLADWHRGRDGEIMTTLDALPHVHNLDGLEGVVFNRSGEVGGSKPWLKWSISTSARRSDEHGSKPD